MGYLNISIQHWVIIFDVMIMPVVVMITINYIFFTYDTTYNFTCSNKTLRIL